MPAFSGFLRSPRTESRLDSNVTLDSLDNGSAEKVQGKQSKRNFFRNLLRKSSSNSESKRASGQFSTNQDGQPIKTPDPPISPMADQNKPLPPPPPSDTVQSEPETTPTRPVKNLQRIISPISLADLHKLFSGAPQFFARSQGLHTGAPHPSVAFPWDLDVDIRDLSDHIQIHDEAWASITAWPHITRDIQRNTEAVKQQDERRKAHFLPRCRERPNMLSMQGIERGTIGYAAALESAVADALQEQDLEADPVSLSERRKKLLNGKSGVRHLTEGTLLDLLRSASETYHQNTVKQQSSNVELYSALFTRVLFPPARVTDSDDPYSLRIQIEALIEVLSTKDVWIDFSSVEWRIRLGRILWGPPGSDSEEDIVINNESPHEPSERYWLLLQILLSCELLLRLDAIAKSYDLRLDQPNLDEIARLNKIATISTRWSIVLARRWLENIQIAKTAADTPEKKPSTLSVGWVATLTEKVGITNPIEVGEHEEKLEDVHFEGRHQERQLNGLLHFARKLQWPNIDALAAKVASNGITLSNTAHSTPAAGTPLSNKRSTSYFPSPRPGIRRGISRSSISALMHPAGWLSNSYISGLILPGEGLNHFLISTLLENDSIAVSKLGQNANLYGGFVYSNRSFWSTASILGRVLAAGKGATECIGWISSEVIPRGAGEAWVNIDAEPHSTSELDKNGKPRIWHKTAIEHDGNVIGGADSSSILPGDFILPSEETIQNRALAIKLESLDLFVVEDSVGSTPPGTPSALTESTSTSLRIQTYSAMMRFNVDIDGEDPREVNLELRHNVNFVTAFPCVSSHHTEILKSPTGSAFQSPQHSPAREPRDFTGHPLHKGFTYSRIPLSALLVSPRNYTIESLLSPSQSPTRDGPTPDPEHSSKHTTNSSIPKVLVVDCTDATTIAFPPRPAPSPHLGRTKNKFGSDLAMLARALCAEKGWNALVSRRGRGCLACAIREASALGWRVVLRIV